MTNPDLAVLFDVDDAPFDPFGTERFGIFPKEATVGRRVEVEGVGDLREWIARVRCGVAEPVLLRRNGGH